MSLNIITNRTVKPYIKAHDFYPGFKLQEECFSKTVVKDVAQKSIKSRFKNSDLDQEGPMSWPHLKSTTELGYEKFLEEVINPKTGEFYPEKDDDGRAVKGTGATYYITDIYRLRRAEGSEFLYTKGRVDAFNSLGEIYTMPFTKENLKSLYDIRQNENLNFIVKDEQTGKPFQLKDVNSQKTFELFQKPFEYLFNAEYIPKGVKAEMRQAAVAEGLIGGTAGDYNQARSSSTTTAKSTYQ